MHAIVDKIYLTAALHFPPDGVADDFLVIFHDIGLDRQAIFGRSFDDAHIPDPHQRHVQGPGNRRGGEGQYINIGAPFLQPFLLGNPEPLFLVDNQEPQVLENNITLQYAMGADQDVDLPVGNPFQDTALLPGTAEPADDVDNRGKAGKPGAEGLIMLLGQNGGRHQHRHLLAAHNRLESSPERHLGFTVTHIAAEQAIHRQIPVPYQL